MLAQDGRQGSSAKSRLLVDKLAETQGFEPWIRFNTYDDLANRCLQPLGHVSVAALLP